MLLLVGGGCAPATVDLSTSVQQSASVPSAYDDREWATVLRENVKDGLVDYEHLKSHDAPLSNYLATIAQVGPQTKPEWFKNRSDRLAYYLNAYNALVLAIVLHLNVPSSVHDAGMKRLEYDYRFMVDGQRRTLAEVRTLAEAEAAGDVRALFCFCDAARGSPPLPDEPLRGESLDQQLLKASSSAMDNPNLVRVDHEQQALLVSVLINHRRTDFLEYYRRQTGGPGSLLSSLGLLANSVRREYLNTAVGYDERVIPFDRRLNRWAAGEPRAVSDGTEWPRPAAGNPNAKTSQPQSTQ
jgi:hypothetical protein